MKKLVLCWFLLFAGLVLFAQSTVRTYQPADINVQRIADFLQTSYSDVRVNSDRVIIYDRGLTSVIWLNQNERYLVFYTWWKLTDEPFSDSQVTRISRLGRDFASRFVFTRQYISDNLMDFTIDYTLPYGGGLSSVQFLDAYRHYRGSLDLFRDKYWSGLMAIAEGSDEGHGASEGSAGEPGGVDESGRSGDAEAEPGAEDAESPPDAGPVGGQLLTRAVAGISVP